jgi:DNA-directed RNA polymerase subunit RPC12/RpoP
MNTGKWRIVKCEDCGHGFPTRQNGGHAYLCPDCNHERQLERAREKNRLRYKERIEAGGLWGGGYHVIKDPDPIAGFPKNAFISHEQHKCMLAFNSYTPGTILANSNGKLLEVVQGTTAQRLVAYG